MDDEIGVPYDQWQRLAESGGAVAGVRRETRDTPRDYDELKSWMTEKDATLYEFRQSQGYVRHALFQCIPDHDNHDFPHASYEIRYGHQRVRQSHVAVDIHSVILNATGAPYLGEIFSVPVLSDRCHRSGRCDESCETTILLGEEIRLLQAADGVVAPGDQRWLGEHDRRKRACEGLSGDQIRDRKLGITADDVRKRLVHDYGWTPERLADLRAKIVLPLSDVVMKLTLEHARRLARDPDAKPQDRPPPPRPHAPRGGG